MFVAPSKLKKNKILRNRTINFETIQRAYGNMILIPTLDRSAIINTFNSGLFRPMQLLAAYTPRRVKPFGRHPVIVDQKDYYASLKSDTHGRFKKGKIAINAYNGQNLFYDIQTSYKLNADIYGKIRKGAMLQKAMLQFLMNELNSAVSDEDYTNAYVIFPMDEYIPNLKRLVTVNTGEIEPFVLFMRQIFGEKLPVTPAYDKKIKLFIFYNPNAKAMVVVDLDDPKFEKSKMSIFQKILRLNNYNATGSEHDELEEGEDVEFTDPDQSEEDAIENKKEEIKNIVFRKVAKTLRAENLNDFEAATPDEQSLMMTIDKKVDNYLEDKDNMKKTFNDMVQDVETDSDVKMKAIRYVETKKASVQRLDTLSKGLEKEVEIIGSIQDLDDDSKDNTADKFKVAEADIDPRIEQSHLSSLDDEYNKKQAMTDLTNTVAAFSNSDYLPLTVDSFDLIDASDDRDLKKTLNVRYKTDEGKPLSFQIDIPDIIDKRYFFLGGNKKVIKKQIIRLPIVKTKSDRVEITTNYNKMTIERTSGKLSRNNLYILKKLKEYANNPAIKIIYGSNSATNSDANYNNDFEYEELADSITSLKTPKYHLNFNRESIDEDISMLTVPDEYFIPDKNRTPLGFELKGENTVAVFFIDNRSRYVYRLDLSERKVDKVADTMFDFITKDVLNADMSKLPSIGKSFVYTYLRFMAVQYPLFAVIGSQIGLTMTLKRYNISYRLSQKRLPGQVGVVEVKFKDMYLYYEDTIRATLLLNALYLLNTQDYTFDQFDTDVPYTHYFMKIFGDALGLHVRTTLRINLSVMIDPITRDILKDLKQPTDIIGLLLYANSLLVGNQYKPQNVLTNYRIRSNELVSDCLYGIIADAYVAYQLHKLNGRPINLNVPKNALIKKLLEQPNVNDKSTLNPTIECEQIAQASSKGYNGINLDAAYTLELRAYDESMNGFISGNATPYSGQAGITRSLAYDPKISSVRGYIPDIKGADLSATNMLSPTELLASFTSAGADAPRQA